MKTSNIGRFKILGVLGLALVAALVLMLTWGHEGAQRAEAEAGPIADFKVNKTADPPIIPLYGKGKFTVTVTQSGPANALGAMIIDSLPSNLLLQDPNITPAMIGDAAAVVVAPAGVKMTLNGAPAPANPCLWFGNFNALGPSLPNTIVCDFSGMLGGAPGGLAAGDIVVLSVQVQAWNIDWSASQNNNQAMAFDLGFVLPLMGQPSPFPKTTDVTMFNEDKQFCTDFLPLNTACAKMPSDKANINVTKVAEKGFLGQSFRNTVTIESIGPSPAYRVELIDDLSAGAGIVSFVPASLQVKEINDVVDPKFGGQAIGTITCTEPGVEGEAICLVEPGPGPIETMGPPANNYMNVGSSIVISYELTCDAIGTFDNTAWVRIDDGQKLTDLPHRCQDRSWQRESFSDTATVVCNDAPPQDEVINIHVNNKNGAKQEGTCWTVFYEEVNPVAGKVPHDVVGDNVGGVKPDCGEPSNLKLSDSDPAGGLLSITIPGEQRAQFGDIWHVQMSFSPVGEPVANNYKCDLSQGPCTVPKVAVGGFQTALDPTGSGGSAGLLAGVIAGVTAGAIALGGAAWYARRRWLA